MRVDLELEPSGRTFAEGLLIHLIDALARTQRGQLFALTAPESLRADLESWAQLTDNAIVSSAPAKQGTRWVFRHGAAPSQSDTVAAVGTRIWLYANFDCNLACDYCCVRSSPRADPRRMSIEMAAKIAQEAKGLGTRELFITGGEPFLRDDIATFVEACATEVPTTVLTNGMLFKGRRGADLEVLDRGRVTLQISLDSPTPELHDLHRGRNSWARAKEGIDLARSKGFRVRLAATVRTDQEEQAFADFLDRERVAAEDRVIRREAARGFSSDGVPLSRADLIPEVTFTDRGIYFHPVGADDDDLRVADERVSVAAAFDAVRAIVERDRQVFDRAASVFRCA